MYRSKGRRLRCREEKKKKKLGEKRHPKARPQRGLAIQPQPDRPAILWTLSFLSLSLSLFLSRRTCFLPGLGAGQSVSAWFDCDTALVAPFARLCSQVPSAKCRVSAQDLRSTVYRVQSTEYSASGPLTSTYQPSCQLVRLQLSGLEPVLESSDSLCFHGYGLPAESWPSGYWSPQHD